MRNRPGGRSMHPDAIIGDYRGFFSLQDILVREGRRFDGFQHVDDWQADTA